MKNFIKLGCMVILTIIAATSCKKDTHALDTEVSPVSTLSAPENGSSYNLDPANGPSVQFKWSASATESLVLYEVVFDKADGDFSKPVYKILSDGSGVQTQATITQKTLNTIANSAGIAALSSGTLKWAVITSKVTNNKLSAVSHTIQVKRPAGFAVVPNAIYLTGSATEGGTDVSKALPFKKISDGVFELYTSLQAGTYTLVDATSGTATTYSISGKSILANGSTTVTGDKTVYRISLDFGNAAVTMTQIVRVDMFLPINNEVWFTLPYIGGSQWEIDNAAVVIPQESWGDESRYKYEFTVKDASGNQSTEWYGSTNRDNSDPTTSTPLNYFYVYPNPAGAGSFDYCFKMVPTYSGKSCKINLNFSPTITQYTNSVTPQ